MYERRIKHKGIKFFFFFRQKRGLCFLSHYLNSEFTNSNYVTGVKWISTVIWWIYTLKFVLDMRIQIHVDDYSGFYLLISYCSGFRVWIIILIIRLRVSWVTQLVWVNRKKFRGFEFKLERKNKYWSNKQTNNICHLKKKSIISLSYVYFLAIF